MPRFLTTAILLCELQPSYADLAKGLDAAARMDWPVARAEFQPLAESGDANAQVNLGNLYMRGLSVPQSYQEALRWYMKAADQGNVTGQGKVGLIHYYGLGVKENHAEAAHWFGKAADQGDPESASILGALFAAGDGVAPDRMQAYVWYAIAADRGKKEAAEQRIALANDMSPAEINEALERLGAWRKQHEPPEPAGVRPSSHKKQAARGGKKKARAKRLRP